MEAKILFCVLAILFLCVARDDASINHYSDIEKYWQSVLPHTVMPKPLKDLIQPAGKMKLGGVINPINNRNYAVASSEEEQIKRVDQKKNMINTNETDESIYFLEKDLHKGKKLSLKYILIGENNNINSAPFLPRHLANSLPFATNKLSQILNHFSIKPNTKEAKAIEETISECEQASIKGERKRCATSLESMIDFTISELGTTNVKVVSTKVEGKRENNNYEVIGVKKIADKESVICHKEYYAYAVYYCHKFESTRSYGVSLVGDKINGSKVKALAVCHTDTSAWNPQHLAFKILKVQPGTVPICHLLAQNTLLWLPNN